MIHIRSFRSGAYALGSMILLALSSVSFASSNEAWKQHDQAMKTACVKASQLKKVKLVSNIMLFDDPAGYSAVLMQGTFPQAHMKNKTGQELCLWNKTTKKAYVSEFNRTS